MIQKHIKLLLLLVSISFASYSNAQHDDHSGHNHEMEDKVAEVLVEADNQNVNTETEEKYSPTATIMHHIADANEFHLFGHTSIPLPVILYSSVKGFTFGMTSMFNHGATAVNGYVLDHGKIKAIQEENFPMGKVEIDMHEHDGHYAYEYNHSPLTIERAGFIDLSITKIVFTMLLTAIFMFIVFILIAKKYKKQDGKEAPSGMQGFFEPIIEFIRDEVAIPNIGEKNGLKYMPYLLSIFFFIWILNMIGQIPFFPGSANVTGNIAFTLVLAVFTMLITNIKGNKYYWGHIFDPLGDSMPWVAKFPLYLILWPIEIIGIFLKPITLMIRLFANITAGHIIVLSLVSLVFVFGNAGQSAGGAAVGAGIAVPFTLFISLIEILVAFIQAFVFTMLSALYIGMATEEHAAH